MTKMRVWVTGTQNEDTPEDVIEEALGTAEQLESGTVIICRGGSLCAIADPETEDCPWCYRIAADDEREADEIVSDMMRPIRH